MKTDLLCGLVVAGALVLCGCKTTKPQWSYPDGNREFFELARNIAVAGIARVDGKTPKLDTRARYETHAGQRKYGGMWCWYSPEWNFWVGGLCYLENPIRPTIGCHPTTGGELHSGVAQHEIGHQILWDVYRDATHNPKYRGALWQWSGPDARGRMMGVRMNADGTAVVADGFAVDAEHPAPEAP